MFPSDDILIARGKWATLGRERYSLIRDMQSLTKRIMHLANPILDDSQEEPPVNEQPLQEIHGCLKGATKIRERLMVICNERAALKAQAWGT